MSKTPVLLIEDNRLLREGLAAMLNEQPDFEVVGVRAEYQQIDRHTAIYSIRLW